MYKDRWQAAIKDGKSILAQGLLQKAIDAYVRGFEIDLRNFYPGINAVTLMEVRKPPDPRRTDLLPVGSALASALAATHEPWMTKTTGNNLALVRAAREQRSSAENWPA